MNEPTPSTSDAIADRVRYHAIEIMRAAGSTLRHYEKRAQQSILMAVMDVYEEAYRAGAKRTDGQDRPDQ